MKRATTCTLGLDIGSTTAKAVLRSPDGEIIDGEIVISKCLSEDHICSKSGENKGACFVHCVFDVINRDVVKKLEKVTVASLVDPDVSVEDIIQKF